MAKKTIILVRHGQYHAATEKELERLTTLGRKQAKYTGKRLKENKIDRIVHSTMPRAIETANIIKKEMGYQSAMDMNKDLCECTPCFPENLRKKYGYTDEAKMKRAQESLERAFKKYFKPSKKESIEVLVCHGNVIRYLVCRFMGIDPLLWRQMDILQGAISIVVYRSKGDHRKILISHNDVGHIPKHQRTFI